MPLIQFHATNYVRAFILNGLASALIIVIAIYIKGKFDTYKDPDGTDITRETNFKSMGLTFMFTFLASIAGYVLLYYTFGFGGGMLSAS
jgi:hypothetical protein